VARHSNLTALLAKATRMPVVEVGATTRIEPNHVVMSPGVWLKMLSDGDRIGRNSEAEGGEGRKRHYLRAGTFIGQVRRHAAQRDCGRRPNRSRSSRDRHRRSRLSGVLAASSAPAGQHILHSKLPRRFNIIELLPTWLLAKELPSIQGPLQGFSRTCPEAKVESGEERVQYPR
jgi:hypothetical protein